MARHICEAPGCLRIARGKYCGVHRNALRVYGDPLKVELVERSRSSDRRKFVRAILNRVTEECIFWKHDTLKIGTPGSVTRSICELVHGNAPTDKHQAAHSCGNGHLGCVNWQHLSWRTPKENAYDTIMHGTNGRKLSVDDVIEIRQLFRDGVFYKDIASKFGISTTHAHRIARGANWNRLKEGDDGANDEEPRLKGPDLFK
jgi:hypothetical protein